MEFRLFYRGSLRANGDKDHKHQIRRAFHPQLKRLWSQAPLKDALPVSLEQSIESIESSMHVLGSQKRFLQILGPYTFLPLVRNDFYLLAQLDVTFLRPGEPGSLITSGGDIDNRLKTLFDALRAPKEINELPSATPTDDENHIFYCLLEDDALVTSVSVLTDRLLVHHQSSDEVILVIHTRVTGTRSTWFNTGIIA